MSYRLPMHNANNWYMRIAQHCTYLIFELSFSWVNSSSCIKAIGDCDYSSFVPTEHIRYKMGVFKVPISIAIFILCSAFCDGVNADTNPSCPSIGQENKNSLALLYPVPGDCSSFYVCAHGKLIKLRCGKGTVFNPNLKVIFHHF